MKSRHPAPHSQKEPEETQQPYQIILGALTLNHGTGFGKTYFSEQTRRLLVRAIQRKLIQPPAKEAIDA
jgi:hypothetical protein